MNHFATQKRRAGSSQRLLDLQSPKNGYGLATDRPFRPSRSQRFTPSQLPRAPSRPSPHPKSHRRSSDRVRSSPLTKPLKKAAPKANKPKPAIKAKSASRPPKPTHTAALQDRPAKTHRSAAVAKARQPSATRQAIRAITGTSLRKGKQETGRKIAQLLAILALKGTKKRPFKEKTRSVNAKSGKIETVKKAVPRKILTSSLPNRTKPAPVTRYRHGLEVYSAAKRNYRTSKPAISHKYRSESQKQTSRPAKHAKHAKTPIPPFQQSPFLPRPRPFPRESNQIRRPKPLESLEATPVPSGTFDSVESGIELREAARSAQNYDVGRRAEPAEGFSQREKTDATSRKGATDRKEETRAFDGFRIGFPLDKRAESGFPASKQRPEAHFPLVSSQFQAKPIPSPPEVSLSTDKSVQLRESLVQGLLERLVWEVIHLPVMQVTVRGIGSWIAQGLWEELMGEVQRKAGGLGIGSCERGRKPLVRLSPRPKSQ